MRNTYRLPAALAATLLAAGGLAAATTTASAVTASGLPEVTPKAPTVVEATCELAGSVTPTAQEGVVWKPFSYGSGGAEVVGVAAVPAAGFEIPEGVRTTWQVGVVKNPRECGSDELLDGYAYPMIWAPPVPGPQVEAATTMGQAVVVDSKVRPTTTGDWLALASLAVSDQGTWSVEGRKVTFTPAKGFTSTVRMELEVRKPVPDPTPHMYGAFGYTTRPSVTVTVAPKVVTPDPKNPDQEGVILMGALVRDTTPMGCEFGESFTSAEAKPGYVFPDGSTKMTLEHHKWGEHCNMIELAVERPTTTAGVPIDPASLVSGLPQGATVAWKDTPDWGRVGEQEVGLVTTLADGTVLTSRPLTLTVTKPAADLSGVTGRDVTATTGVPLPASQAVSGLPEGGDRLLEG